MKELTPEQLLSELDGWGDRTVNFGVYVGVKVKDYRLLKKAVELLRDEEKECPKCGSILWKKIYRTNHPVYHCHFCKITISGDLVVSDAEAEEIGGFLFPAHTEAEDECYCTEEAICENCMVNEYEKENTANQITLRKIDKIFDDYYSDREI